MFGQRSLNRKEKKEVVLYADAQPMYIRGYHVPGYGSRDYLALELLEEILSAGRSSRLYAHLVLEKKIGTIYFCILWISRREISMPFRYICYTKSRGKS